jgi:hypothetical protein
LVISDIAGRQAGPKAWKRLSREWKRRKSVADFYQNGTITTLHNLGERSTEDLERDAAVQ